ncbi:MAG: hypothetical protein K6F82_06315 [Sphaerochaetaceae bacterium]|nr:hypothetical protein [Sphaerochaetaceae bacterium]
MIRKILLISAIVLSLVSCASMNPFTEENPFIGAIAEDGKYIFTTTDYESILSLPIDIQRISGSYDPQTETMYGVIEGDFSKTIVNAGIKASGQFTKNKEDKLTYYVHNETGIQVTVPASGIILFSTDNIKEIYNRYFTKEKETVLDRDIISKLYSDVSGVYVKSPTELPQTGIDLSDAAVERFDYILLISDYDKFDTAFTLTTEEYADSFFKLLKAAYISMLKQNGEKADVSYLKLIITQEGNTIYLKDQDLEKNYVLQIFNEVIK